MLVRDARAAARDWVESTAAPEAAFRGAFVTGSAAYLAADEELPATSDVDVIVLTAGRQPPPKLGKLIHDGVLLDVAYASWSATTSAQLLSRSYVFAPALAAEGTVLADPTGRLATLHRVIAARFTEPEQIRHRIEDVRTRCEKGLDELDPTAPWAQQVLAVFPLSLPTQVPLVAALRPPTVRLRYLAARAVTDAGTYASLLDLLGCASVSAEVVSAALDRLTAVFDVAAAVVRTPFVFAADLTPAARPVALAGSRALVATGDHREAVFWILATYARCQLVLHADAPDQADDDTFAETVAALSGLRTPADIRNRRTDALDLLGALT